MLENSTIKVLVAEDDISIQEILNMKLDMMGDIAISNVDDGYMVIEEVITNDYDLILMDLQMPNLDGVEATKRIIEAFDGAGPMIVAVTGNTDVATKEHCLKIGMDGYITKPVDNNELRKVLSLCAEKKTN